MDLYYSQFNKNLNPIISHHIKDKINSSEKHIIITKLITLKINYIQINTNNHKINRNNQIINSNN